MDGKHRGNERGATRAVQDEQTAARGNAAPINENHIEYGTAPMC